MLDQNERRWRNCSPPPGGAGGRIVERSGVVGVTPGAKGSSAVQNGETDCRSCPVCEFAGAEYNDVYGHLMTAHRKSTLSELLLEG